MGDTPDPPNPKAQGAADQAAQTGASVASSIVNNPNQYNPYGSQTYSIAGYETIYDAQGKLLASGRGTYFTAPPPPKA